MLCQNRIFEHRCQAVQCKLILAVILSQNTVVVLILMRDISPAHGLQDLFQTGNSPVGIWGAECGPLHYETTVLFPDNCRGRPPTPTVSDRMG